MDITEKDIIEALKVDLERRERTYIGKCEEQGKNALVIKIYCNFENELRVIKVPYQSIRSADDMQKLEGIKLKKLVHKHVVKMFDMGILDVQSTKYWYFEMEFIEGMSLKQINPDVFLALPTENRFKLFFQLVETITYIQNKFEEHGDLHPGNILIDSEENIKIIDPLYCGAEYFGENKDAYKIRTALLKKFFQDSEIKNFNLKLKKEETLVQYLYNLKQIQAKYFQNALYRDLEENENANKTIKCLNVTILNEEQLKRLKIFIWELNRLLNSDYKIVKQKFSKNNRNIGLIIWKSNDTEKNLPYWEYSFFDIPFGYPYHIVQISFDFYQETARRLNFSSRSVDNLNNVISNPQIKAKEILNDYLSEIFTNKHLDISDSSEIVTDIIFHMIYHENIPENIPKRLEYNISEINTFMRKHIDQVNAEISKGVHYGTDDIVLCRDMLRILGKNNIVSIKSMFPLPSKENRYYYNRYSNEELFLNLKKIFSFIPKLCEKLISKNFPSIVNKISLFRDATTILVEMEFFMQYDSYFHTSPHIKLLFLHNPNEIGVDFKFFKKEQKNFPILTKKHWNSGLVYNDVRYEPLFSTTLNRIFEPSNSLLFNVSYYFMESFIEHYFNIENIAFSSSFREDIFGE